MPKKHPDDSSVIRYHIKPPEIWAAIRAEWEQGKGTTLLGRQYDVSPSSVQSRRLREGWTRSTPLERLTAPAPTAIDALTIAESALARSVEALAQGRASDAMALIKAGDAIGAFADFVARLRKDASAGSAADARP